MSDLTYRFNPNLFDYKGHTPLKLFARKIEKDDQTTYSIEPIRAQSKLWAWLQEHSRFFNTIITAILSISIRKDVDCKILDGVYVYPKQSGNSFIGALIQCVKDETSDFFDDYDIEDHLKGINQQILSSPNLTKKDKIGLLTPTLTSFDRITVLLKELKSEEKLKKKVIFAIFNALHNFDKETIATIFKGIYPELKNFDNPKKLECYSMILKSYYKQRAPIDESVIKEIKEEISANITNGNFNFDNLPILAQILQQYCPKNTFSEEVSRKILSFSSVDWKANQFIYNKWINKYEISIPLALVNIFPEKILESFYSQCFLQYRQCQDIEIVARDLKQNTLDALDRGGLRRQFISDLFEALARKTALGNSSELSASEVSQGGWLPKLSKYNRAKQDELYIAMGKLMGMCLTSSGQYSLVIGEVFDPGVFNVIEAAPPRILDKGFENLDDSTLVTLYNALEKDKDNQLLKFYNIPNFNTCDEKTLQKMIICAYVEDPEEMPAELAGKPSKAIILKYQSTIRAKLKSQVVTYAKENDSLPVILKIAEGIAFHYDNRNNWSYQNWSKNKLEKNIQGSFDKKTLKEALQGTYSNNSLSIGYLKKWIDESNVVMVKKFVKAVTGSTTLAVNSNIRVIQLNSSDNLPEYHTCGKEVVIPQYNNYAIFKKKLEQSFGCLDEEGFQLR